MLRAWTNEKLRWVIKRPFCLSTLEANQRRVELPYGGILTVPPSHSDFTYIEAWIPTTCFYGNMELNVPVGNHSRAPGFFLASTIGPFRGDSDMWMFTADTTFGPEKESPKLIRCGDLVSFPDDGPSGMFENLTVESISRHNVFTKFGNALKPFLPLSMDEAFQMATELPADIMAKRDNRVRTTV